MAHYPIASLHGLLDSAPNIGQTSWIYNCQYRLLRSAGLLDRPETDCPRPSHHAREGKSDAGEF